MTETINNNKKSILPFEKSHAFIIGINDYLHLNKLTTAVNDAKKLAEVLTREQRFKVHPPLINASYKKIKNLLEKTIIKKVGEDDRVLFYFAGHGIASHGDGIPEGYIMPVDAVKGDVDSYILMGDIRDAIDELRCPHVLLILDCCFSGAFKWSSRFRDNGTLIPKRIYKERFERFVEDSARQVITSAAWNQQSVDILQGEPIGMRNGEGMMHSPFANALFDGLNGAADIIPADGCDGLITASELYLYLREQVETKTMESGKRYRQTPRIFSLERHDIGEFIFLNPMHPLNLPPIPQREPYKGLNSFEEKDKELFYGRKRIIEELIQKIDKGNLVVVTGASGTGKSSVVKAGLIPGLREKGYNILPVIRPGKSPVVTLEKALHESKLFNLGVSFSMDMKIISEKLNLTKNVLVIDQYEELVTQCQEKEEKNRFIEILEVLLDSNKKNLFKIILTVRSDFEPHFKHLGLEKYWENAVYKVPPFTIEELREVIVNPTIQEVLFFEPPTLVDRIIDEVFQEPGALPLLSFTLSELYRLYKESKRTDRVLREGDYNKLGGVIGALHRRADDLFNGLEQKHQNTMRKIMLRMVSIEGSELAGKKVMMEELEFSKEEEPCVKEVIAQLLDARLLLKDKDENEQIYVEPAHDALIRGWTTLWEWIEEHEKEKIILQAKLEAAVKDYSIKKVKLWDNDPRLDLLRKELKSPDSCLNKHEVSFIKKSIKLRRRKRNSGLTIAIILIIILSGLLIYALNKARIAQANYLSSQAQLKLNNNDHAGAILLAKKAYELDKNKNVTQVLSEAASETLKRPLYNVNMRHGYHVNDALFSPFGSLILTISSDKTAKLWDLQGNHLVTFPHNSIVYSGQFSPDGSKILTVSMEKAAKLWDLQGNLLKEFKHEDRMTDAVFSPAGSKILTASYDNTARLWNIQGELLNVISHKSDLEAALFSPGGSKILTICHDKTAWLFDLRCNLLKGFLGVNSAQFSPNGKYILLVCFNNTVKLWNLEDSTEKVYSKHSGIVNFAVFSPNSSSILIIYLRGAVELWDMRGQVLAVLGPHKDSVNYAEFSIDGTQILTASSDNTAKIWDIDGTLVADLNLHRDRVLSAAFSPDGTRVLTASMDNTAKLWDLKDQLATDFTRSTTEMKFANFSADGTKVLTVSAVNTVQLWNIRGHFTANLNQHTKLINTAIFSPGGTRILTASADNTARLWDLEGNLITTFDGHTDNVNSAVFSPDGSKVLTASYDGTAKLWDLQGKLLKNLDKHTSRIYTAVFSPDGSKILTASEDRTAKLWHLEGACITDFKIHSQGVTTAIFSPGGTRVLSLAAGARLWDLNGGLIAGFNHLKHLENRMRIEENFSTFMVMFSPNNKQVLTVTRNNTAYLWDMRGNLITRFNHDSSIQSAHFSPGGTRIVFACTDNTVKLWDLQGNLLADFDKHQSIVHQAIFSPDSKRILSVSADKTIKLWYTPRAMIQWLNTAGFVDENQ